LIMRAETPVASAGYMSLGPSGRALI